MACADASVADGSAHSLGRTHFKQSADIEGLLALLLGAIGRYERGSRPGLRLKKRDLTNSVSCCADRFRLRIDRQDANDRRDVGHRPSSLCEDSVGQTSSSSWLAATTGVCDSED